MGPVSKILETPRTWCKHSYWKGKKLCLSYALGVASDTGKQIITRKGRLMAAIRQLFPDRGTNGNIIAFNDHPKTTHKDVLAVLKKAKL
jgi:hypothetical protein